jgi:hypothetical protein
MGDRASACPLELFESEGDYFCLIVHIVRDWN